MSCSHARILLSPSHRNHISRFVIRPPYSPLFTSHGLTPLSLLLTPFILSFLNEPPARTSYRTSYQSLVPLSSLSLSLSSGARSVRLINEGADILGNLDTELFSSGSLTFYLQSFPFNSDLPVCLTSRPPRMGPVLMALISMPGPGATWNTSKGHRVLSARPQSTWTSD